MILYKNKVKNRKALNVVFSKKDFMPNTFIASCQRAISFCFLLLLISCTSKTKVDLIIHHANIYTVDSAFTVAEAMSIKDEKIIATGTNEYILSMYNSDTIVDLSGKVVFPGFIDAHCHFSGYAMDSWKCNLVGTTSFDEVLNKIVNYSKTAPMLWVYGRGWDQNDWLNKTYPTKKVLDSLFPNRPVFLKRIDGHAAIANQTALDIAKITTGTSINGGLIEEKNGRLTGLLLDNAMDLVERYIPSIPDSLSKKYFEELQQKCFEVGLTSVHDCGVNEHTIKLIDEAQKKGHLKMKIFALLCDSNQYYNRWVKKGPYITERLHVGGFKLYADGALGSRGACLLQHYTDKPNWNGFLLNDIEHFKKVAAVLAGSNLQMCTHAIGDSGNRVVLKIYQDVLQGKNDKRWRIEHAQVVDKNDVHYFGQNNIIPSVQPTHATSDMYWAQDRIGAERIINAYAYQYLLHENGWMPLGTDFPVEDISPFKTFFSAVARTDANGYPKGGFQKENGLSREQTLRGMTIWAAKAAFEEKEKGSLEKGKWADFIIVDNNLMKCAESAILKTKVLSTFINGEKVY